MEWNEEVVCDPTFHPLSFQWKKKREMRCRRNREKEREVMKKDKGSEYGMCLEMSLLGNRPG